MSLQEQLIRHEGLRLKPYLDTVGKWTIGVGRNLSDKGISREEAMLLLDNDILEAQTAVIHEFPWAVKLDSARRDVLINMAFNMGIGTLREFRKFLPALAAGQWEKAAIEMLNSTWAKQVGERARELATIIRTGHDPFVKNAGGVATG